MGRRGAWSNIGRRVGRIAPCVMLLAGLGPVAAGAGSAAPIPAVFAAQVRAAPSFDRTRRPDPVAPTVAAFAPAAPQASGCGAHPVAAVGADGEDTLTPPPVVDPKSVETRRFGPGGERFVGHEEVLSPGPVLSLSGTAKWDDAYDTLVAANKTLEAELGRLGLKRAGDVFVVYRESGDDSFKYEVQMPFSGVTAAVPSGGMTLGASYAGKILRFSHSGAFMDMDNTYEMIANYLDQKNITADDLYMEQYRTDIVTSAPDALKIDILVPVP